MSTSSDTQDQLRQCCAWCRTFVKHAQRELIDEPNNYPKAADQLMVLLADLKRENRNGRL